MIIKRKINENYGYHYGDIEHKSETRDRQGGYRDTGHFGTGFYCVGYYTPEEDKYYGKRECYKIDFSKYNLFKPSSYKEASMLHSILRTINGTSEDILSNSYKEYPEEITEIVASLSLDLSDIEKLHPELTFDEVMDLWSESNPKDYISSEELVQAQEKLEVACKKGNLSDMQTITAIEYLQQGKLGGVEEVFKEVAEDRNNELSKWEDTLFDIELIFGKQATVKAIEAIKSNNQEDSKSTVFMKSLGYEGIDVTHLGKTVGEAGFDNFSYGSVIYDLKPNTYEKIKERSVTEDFSKKKELKVIPKKELFGLKLYFISRSKSLKKLSPRMPNSMAIEMENPTVKRVCFAPSISQCLSAVGVGGDTYYVYVPAEPLATKKWVKVLPKDVFDALSTDEYWCLDDIKVIPIAIIKATKKEIQLDSKYGYTLDYHFKKILSNNLQWYNVLEELACCYDVPYELSRCVNNASVLRFKNNTEAKHFFTLAKKYLLEKLLSISDDEVSYKDWFEYMQNEYKEEKG